MATQSGYQNAELQPGKPGHILFTTSGMVTKTITIDPTARDAGSPLGDTFLREGLILVPITATGLYKHFNDAAIDGTQLPNDAVVLKQMIQIGTERVVAAAYSAGNFKANMLYVAGVFDWSAVQRLVRHTVA